MRKAGEQMAYTVERAHLGDEAILAHIQTESWKAGFRGILNDEILARCTQLDKVEAMYRRSLESGEGNGYILRIDGKPHCIAWWDQSRAQDMPGYAELYCIHSLQDHWRRGFGSRMMERVLEDMKNAGYARVMLWVFAENTRARAFYEAHGFADTGKIKPGIEPAEICYVREL